MYQFLGCRDVQKSMKLKSQQKSRQKVPKVGKNWEVSQELGKVAKIAKSLENLCKFGKSCKNSPKLEKVGKVAKVGKS